MKKATILVLLAVLLAPAVFANGKQETKTPSVITPQAALPSNVRSIVVGIPEEFGDLSPFGGNSAGRNYVKYNLWETLAVYSAFGQTIDEMDLILAKDVQIINDVTSRITIYDYIYDSEGNHITANDVKWSYEQAAACGLFQKVTTNLKSIKVVDNYTVELVLKKDAIGMLEYMLSYVAIASQKAYKSSPDKMSTKPVTTGPYKVIQAISGSKLVLQKNADYWQKDPSKRAYIAKQPLDTITFLVIKEPAQMAIALETGAIDIASNIEPSEVSRFMNPDGTGKNGYQVSNSYGGMATMLNFNCSDASPLSNELLRKAVCYAIDQKGIVEGALRGHGTPIGTCASNVSSDYNPEWDVDYYNYNPQKAKELLAKAGYKPNELTLSIMIQQTAEFPMVAQLIQAYLADVGIKATILAYDNALFSQYRFQPDLFDMMISIMGTSDYVVSAWDLQFNGADTPKGASACFVKDLKLQELLDRAKGIHTHNQKTVNAFADYLEEKAYSYGLYVKSNYCVANSKVAKIVRHPFGHVIAGACSYR